jgi:uncharacterized protein YaaQ
MGAMYRSPAEFHSSPEDEAAAYGRNITNQGSQPDDKPVQPVRYLVSAVIQVQDMQPATRALEGLGLRVTNLPSTGAFLGRQNVTLMVGIPESLHTAVLDAIRQTCHQRVEYVSTPLEGAPMPIPLSTPITLGGASVWTIEVERYEEF